MTKVEEMWTALAAYQPQAVAAGHGPSWARMCKEKTLEAAAAAAAAANAAAAAAVADAVAYAAAFATAAANAAAADADAAAAAVVAAAANAAAAAADAAADAANAAYHAAAADAKKWAQIAIGRITRVLVKPAPEQYTALEQALTRLQKRYGELEAKIAAQPAPVQEPVAWTDEQLQMLNFLYGAGEWDGLWFDQKHPAKKGAFWWRSDLRRLFTTPPAAQRTWVGLTDEDAHLLANEHLRYQTEGYEVSGIYDLARAIETKLKEKNGV